MKNRLSPFLMFVGEAEQAMNVYVSVFPDSAIDEIERWGADEAGVEGTIKTARLTVGGQTLMCSDSPNVHDFTFTPSTSFFFTCESEMELDGLAERLLNGGKALMPPDNYGFSRRFAWIEDRFGVSWQLNLV